jgi:hypothetical protein
MRARLLFVRMTKHSMRISDLYFPARTWHSKTRGNPHPELLPSIDFFPDQYQVRISLSHGGKSFINLNCPAEMLTSVV